MIDNRCLLLGRAHDRESALILEGWHRQGMCRRKSLLDVVEEWGIPVQLDDRETDLGREDRSHILFTHRPHGFPRSIFLKLRESASCTTLAATCSSS